VGLGVATVRVVLLVGDLGHQLVGHAVGDLGPGVDDLVVLLTLGDQTVGVLLLILLGELLGLFDQALLALGDDDVVLAEADAGLGRLAEAQTHHLVGEDDRRLLTAV